MASARDKNREAPGGSHGGMAPLWIVAVLVPTAGQAEGRLTDNATVLAQFAQATGAPAPQLATTEGGTRIEWHGSAALDGYTRNASGGQVLTPYTGGNFYKAGLLSDLRGHTPEGDTNWFQFSFTATDDRSVLPQGQSQINTLGVGRAGQGYRLMAGDVPVSYSALGANTALRGVLAERYFGDMLLSASAGVISNSWEALEDKDKRLAFLRNAFALKAETTVAQGGKIFITAQGYSDDSDSAPPGSLAPVAASGRSATLGFNWRGGAYSIQGEAGVSRFSEDGAQDRDDNAFIVDAAWQAQGGGLRAGYHDVGRFYTSLSAQGVTGVQEGYLNGNWSAASWLNLTADLRRSENQKAAPPTPPPVPTIPPSLPPPPTPHPGRTDAATLGAQITFPQAPGLSLGLNAGESRGKSDIGVNEISNYGANLAYASKEWNAGVAYQNNDLSGGLGAGSDSRTGTWTVNLGGNLSDAAGGAPGTWTLGANLTGNFQRQDLGGGGSLEFDTYALTLSGQRARWGNFSASGGIGHGTDAAGQALRTKWYQLDAGRKLGERGGIKLYARGSSNYQSLPAIAYSDATVGLQLSYAF